MITKVLTLLNISLLDRKVPLFLASSRKYQETFRKICKVMVKYKGQLNTNTKQLLLLGRGGVWL